MRRRPIGWLGLSSSRSRRRRQSLRRLALLGWPPRPHARYSLMHRVIRTGLRSRRAGTVRSLRQDGRRIAHRLSDRRRARFSRLSASPGAALAIERMQRDTDIRAVLPTIRIPTHCRCTKRDPHHFDGQGSNRRIRSRARGDGRTPLEGNLRPLASLSGARRPILDQAIRVLHSRSSASASSVETSATRRSLPVCRTPSSSITVQKGHATASVSAPVAAASRARSSLIWLPRSSIHM